MKTLELNINQLPPALNGSNGLINLHWTKLRKIKQDWVWLIKAENPKFRFKNKVKINYTRISVNAMDYDNIGGSFKVVGDALVKNKILIDDGPDYITELTLNWQKAKTRQQQGVKIEIKEVQSDS